jgi:serine protease AprX
MAKRSTPKKRPVRKRRAKAQETTTEETGAKPAPDPHKDIRPNPLLYMEQATIPRALEDHERRGRWGLSGGPDEPGDYMIELNLLHQQGLEGAKNRFDELSSQIDAAHKPQQVSKSYYSWTVSLTNLRRLVMLDEETDNARKDRTKLAIYKVWPDFKVFATLDRSVSTVKADAAVRTFEATGQEIVWAVIDSGVDATHPHFAPNKTLTDPSVNALHYDFTFAHPTPAAAAAAAMVDDFGHGTHVAGIIAGQLDVKANPNFEVYQKTYQTDEEGNSTSEYKKRTLKDGSLLSGIAPRCRIVSLKVLDSTGGGKTSDVIRALNRIRENINGDPKLLRIHGVNLSLGYEFDAEVFACGQSPVCVEVDRLVNSGVVVVTAAGNTGYGKLMAGVRPTRVGLSNTINDPGNATLAITVGSTHRDAPHTYGVSYFSSKGPTGDGRLKPDLVAPGERITSCAAGQYLQGNGGSVPKGVPGYIDESGTSMAAPHVSGAIAAFLSIRREFIQKPQRVKEIFMSTATCLGRERYFQGSGLLDLMRAIQSV